MPELTTINNDLRAAVESQLERMTSAPVFRRKPRVRSFLEYTVRQTLDQQHTKLKEYSIAVEVFNRPEDFDPRLDSIVRVEARRLRATVERYYETDGREDDIVIQYRRGNYVPSFDRRGSVPQHATTFADGLAAGLFTTGALLVGILAADAPSPEVYSELAGRQASVTILRAPFEPETLELLKSGDPRIVLLKPATLQDLNTLLSANGRTAVQSQAV